MKFAGEPRANTDLGGFAGYSIDELVATADIARRQDPRWRWVYPVTRTTRDYFIEQMPALVGTYCVAVALVFVAGIIERTLPATLMAAWLIESAAGIAVRISIFKRMVRASPVEVASKPWLRLLPVMGIALAAVHWSWTATLFLGPQLNLVTVVVLLSFVMLSVACLGVAPASPLICAAYLLGMWPAAAYMLLETHWASGGVLLVVAAALAGTLWSGYYIVVSGVRRTLIRSDEVDLLMRELQDRNAEVEALRASAAADLETRSAVFASASHDLRQRVHALKLLARASTEPAASAGSMSRLAGAIDELEAFMTDVLHVVGFQGDKAAQEVSEVAVQDLFQNVELQFEEIANQKQVRLRVRATSLAIRTNVVMLSRVLDNLVSNAVKFTSKGVLVNARLRDGEVHLEVWDQGHGLDLDKLNAEIVATRPRPVGEGFGLGLMIVRRFVDALGCRFDVHSREGRGTRARVVVPAHQVVQKEK